MSETSAKKNRIAKNTAFLYFRMLVTMGVGLFTSRIVLSNLGIDDFGIYNVVGGVVAMFSFLNLSLTNASSRFLSTALGKDDKIQIKNTFNCVITIHSILAVIVFLLAETIGLWFLMTKMIIPADRMTASIWVFQLSILTMILSIVIVPFNALIVSHERMSAFAYISIFEAFAKLGTAYCISLFAGSEKLIMYAVLLSVVQISVGAFYISFCRKKFIESHFKFQWEKKMSMEILKFSGWTMNGNLAVVGYTQGLNILLNMFFGPAVNAARGISVQVQTAVRSFYMSFQTALNPQVIKSYSKGELDYMHSLIEFGSKISFYLVMILILPLIFNTQFILSLWLIQIPQYTAQFIQVMLCIALINTLGNLLAYGIHATGILKKYQLVEGGILLSIVPIAYILLKFFHISPIQVFVVYFLIESIAQTARILIVCPQIGLSYKSYFKKVLIPTFSTLVISIILPILFSAYSSFNGWYHFIISLLVCVGAASITTFFIGLTSNERKIILKKITYLHKNSNQ